MSGLIDSLLSCQLITADSGLADTQDSKKKKSKAKPKQEPAESDKKGESQDSAREPQRADNRSSAGDNHSAGRSHTPLVKFPPRMTPEGQHGLYLPLLTIQDICIASYCSSLNSLRSGLMSRHSSKADAIKFM